MNEVSYYPELSKQLEIVINANLSNGDITVRALYLPFDGSNVRSYLDKYINTPGVNASDSLRQYAIDVPKLRTDVVLVLDNPVTNRFKLVIVEVKLLGSAGLTELSQLIGYSLVTKAEYGLLINVNGGISNELASIMSTDKDLTYIERHLNDTNEQTTTSIGVMSYTQDTYNFEYFPTQAIKSLPHLVETIQNQISK
jgi:hypothetical protein